MNVIPFVLAMFSVLFPTKQWYGTNQPLTIKVQSDAALSLVLTTFDGKPQDAKGSTDVPTGGSPSIDIRNLYPELATPGSHILFAVPKGAAPASFVGTPLVIEVLTDKHQGGVLVDRVEPLQYAIMTTDQGSLKMIFYYDSAPNAVESFLRLASQGFYDGLTFHRIVPGFVIQGGDPRGDGTGGPGYSVDAEFSDRPHEEGVLSMARASDPNSAGSQFFVCLDYKQTQQLDHNYTAFGKVIEGMDAVKKIAAAPLADPENGKPTTPQVIQKVEVFSVVPGKNPYADIMNLGKSK
jgi:cyclophilin family peptidyl-prolyl cis-trans isomerase